MKKSLADRIEQYLKVLIERSEEKQIEIQRAELAETFRCVPSQVTYVIGTRFTEREGYITESRRGGKGYVKITRFSLSQDLTTILDRNRMFDLINNFTERGLLTERENELVKYLVLTVSGNMPEEQRKELYRTVSLALAEYFKQV